MGEEVKDISSAPGLSMALEVSIGVFDAISLV